MKGEAIMGYKETNHIIGYSYVGKVLRGMREERGYSVDAVSRKLGMNPKTLRSIENSDGNTGSVKCLLLLLRLYGVKPARFWQRVEEQKAYVL